MNATTLELSQDVSLPELKLAAPPASLRLPITALALTAVLFGAGAPRRLASALRSEKPLMASRAIGRSMISYPVPVRPIR